MPVTKAEVERLKEIKDTMLELLDEAIVIVRHSGDRFQYDRAKAYWHPHIQMALSDDHMYMGNDGATLDDAINSLEDKAVGDDIAEVESEDGTYTFQFERDDGFIRQVDEHGNYVTGWEVGEEEYELMKAKYFPNEAVVAETDAE